MTKVSVMIGEHHITVERVEGGYCLSSAEGQRAVEQLLDGADLKAGPPEILSFQQLGLCIARGIAQALGATDTVVTCAGCGTTCGSDHISLMQTEVIDNTGVPVAEYYCRECRIAGRVPDGTALHEGSTGEDQW